MVRNENQSWLNVMYLVSVKKGTVVAHYKPNLHLDNVLVPPVNDDCHFTCLGCHLGSEMTDKQHKRELLKATTEQMETTDKLPLLPKNKLKLY